jgi:GrpB-like predicted nucleotidyltransferase (UPF0157 family)
MQGSRSIRGVEVAEYDPGWVASFHRIRKRLWPAVSDFALCIEHVGSTSAPGLAAKPLIDIDLVIPSQERLPLAIDGLATFGYTHRGNLGIEDRAAFSAPTSEPVHNLYVCGKDSLALRNHLILRNHLRSYPDSVTEYSKLKRSLARQFPYDIDSYIDGKTEFILTILAQYGLASDHLDSIREANRKG